MIYESIMNIRKDGHQIGLRFTVYIHILKSGKRFVFISNFHILKIFIFTVMPIKPKNTITVFTVHFSTKLFSGISECLCVCVRSCPLVRQLNGRNTTCTYNLTFVFVFVFVLAHMFGWKMACERTWRGIWKGSVYNMREQVRGLSQQRSVNDRDEKSLHREIERERNEYWFRAIINVR